MWLHQQFNSSKLNTRNHPLLCLGPGSEPPHFTIVSIHCWRHLRSDQENLAIVENDSAVVPHVPPHDGPKQITESITVDNSLLSIAHAIYMLKHAIYMLKHAIYMLKHAIYMLIYACYGK